MVRDRQDRRHQALSDLPQAAWSALHFRDAVQSIRPARQFRPDESHVLPALIRKFHEAKASRQREVTVWGTGKPLREFLHVDDLARGVVFCLDNYDEYGHINCGSGEEVSIGALAQIVANVVEFDGEIVFDASKPDGTPRKLMDSSRIRARAWTRLPERIARTATLFPRSQHASLFRACEA